MQSVYTHLCFWCETWVNIKNIFGVFKWGGTCFKCFSESHDDMLIFVLSLPCLSGISMKRVLLLVCLWSILPIGLYASGSGNTQTQADYFAIAMRSASERFYKQFDKLTQERLADPNGDELVFLQKINFYKHFYEQHSLVLQELVYTWQSGSHTRWVARNLDLLAGQKPENVKTTCENYLARKEPTETTAVNFRFIAQWYLAQADYDKAGSVYGRLLQTKWAVSQDAIGKALCLSAQIESDSFEKEIRRQADTKFAGDTLAQIGLRAGLARLFLWRGDEEAAKRELIATQYLAQHWSGTPSVENQLLLGNIALQLTGIYIEQTQYEDALRCSNQTFEYLRDTNTFYARFTHLDALYNRARLYLKGGDLKTADTLFRRFFGSCRWVQDAAPVQADYLILKGIDAYNEVCRWFDRNAEYDSLLRLSKQMRGKLMQLHDPFMLLAYSDNCVRLGQKCMDIDMNIKAAEEQWLIAKDVLLPYEKSQIILYGEPLASLLHTLATVKLTLKTLDEASEIMEQLLQLREHIYRLLPSSSKPQLMMTLAHMANLELVKKQYDQARLHIDRAEQYAQELKDVQLLEQIQRFRKDLK